MKYFLAARAPWALPLLAGLVALCCATNASAFQAGAAKVDISPPLGAPLNGYGERMGRGAVELNDPIWVRCLYLDDGDTAVYLLAADLCIINRELREAVIERAAGLAGPENIILTATHNHSGQGGMVKDIVFRFTSGPYREDILEAASRGFVQAMEEAYERREEANIGYATGAQDDLTTNRREEDGPRDSQIGVIRVDNLDGDPIAIVANLAAHPTTISGDDLYTISADYPGFFYEALEAHAGGDTVALFLNGAMGNQRPQNPTDGEGFERARGVGELLAERVYALSEDIEATEAALHLGYSEPGLPPTLATSLLPETTVLHVLEIDGLCLSFFPGEPCVELGLDLRGQVLERGYDAHFSVSTANDHLFYFAPPEYYTKPYYEQEFSLLGPRIGDWFNAQFHQLMSRGDTPGEPAAYGAAESGAFSGGERLRAQGDGYAIGHQRGGHAGALVDEVFETAVRRAVRERRVTPDNGWMESLPAFIDVTPLSLPFLAMQARPALDGASGGALRELEGLAIAAGLPADALAIMQFLPAIAEAAPDTLPKTRGRGKVVQSDQPLVAHHVEWEHGAAPVVLDIAPDNGRRHIVISWPWEYGALSGMNDAGVTIIAVREETGSPFADGLPLEWAIREALANSGSAEDARDRLEALELHNATVIVTDAAGAAYAAPETGGLGDYLEAGPVLLDSAGLVTAEPVDENDEEEPAAWSAADLMEHFPAPANGLSYTAVYAPGGGEAYIRVTTPDAPDAPFETITFTGGDDAEDAA